MHYIAAIVRVTDIFCFGVTYAYAYLADDGGVIVPPTTRRRAFTDLVNRAMRSVALANHSFIVRNGREVYSLSYARLAKFVYYLLECTFPDLVIPQIDCDVVKHAIVHYKVILL